MVVYIGVDVFTFYFCMPMCPSEHGSDLEPVQTVETNCQEGNDLMKTPHFRQIVKLHHAHVYHNTTTCGKIMCQLAKANTDILPLMTLISLCTCTL